jgi:hypothetical protein
MVFVSLNVLRVLRTAPPLCPLKQPRPICHEHPAQHPPQNAVPPIMRRVIHPKQLQPSHSPSPDLVIGQATVQRNHQLSVRSLALQLILRDLKRVLQQLLLLLDVAGLETGSDGSARVSAGVHHVPAIVVLSLVEQGLDARLHETPRACVEGLFLTPDDGLRVGV